MTTVNKPQLLYDKVAKKLFTNERVGKKLAARVIQKTLDLDIDADELANNLEFKHPGISPTLGIVDNESDILLESDESVWDIEINLSNGTRFERKNKAYICGLYLKQLPKSNDYRNLKKVIQINLDYFDYFQHDLFHYISYLTEVHTSEFETKDIEIHHINLAKLNKVDYNDIVNNKGTLSALLYFFVCNDQTLLEEVYEGDSFMKMLKEEAEKIVEGIDRLLYYDADELHRLDREDAIKEGREEGREEGRQEGRQEGIEQGTSQAKHQIAKNLLAEGLDINVISKTTGLSLEELSNLKESISK